MPNKKATALRRSLGFTPVIILIVVLVIAAIAGAFYLGTKKGNIAYSPTSNPVSYSPSPTNLTANWKTYSNSQYRFSFEYPQNFGTQGKVGGPITSSSENIASFSDPTTIREGTDAPFNGFSVYVAHINDVNFEDYIQTEKSAFKKRGQEITGENVTNEKSFSSDGGTGYSFNVTPNIELFYIPYTNEAEAVVRAIVFAKIHTTDSFNKTFNQILSTFKFTN